ncbi:MAG: DUF1846 family protein [Candidatus Absconditabacterales bacterium]|nr:DUF1846 family protein [Candidatus Absconditabacterales bacterium]
MTTNNEIIFHKKHGFDGEKYIEMQTNQILDSLANFSGKLYLEVGGKFLRDPHASRVLPGFLVDSKQTIFYELRDKIEVFYCVNAEDIISNKKFSDQNLDFSEYVSRSLSVIERSLGVKPIIVINKIDVATMFDLVLDFERKFQKKQYSVFERYKISSYPYNIGELLSDNGFGSDDHIPTTKNLVLVTGAGANSGKLSTCLGQIYLDNEIDIKSGYAKFEVFPLKNRGLEHPVNSAYELAVKNTGNHLSLDSFHKKEYGQEVVVNQKDLESFEATMTIIKNIVNHKNYMIKYKSPTDMIINTTSFCITDEEAVEQAAKEEIKKRS